MTNRDSIIRKCGFNPFAIQTADDITEFYNYGCDEKQQGFISVVKIRGKWYCLREYLDCPAGKLPEHTYIRTSENTWKLKEIPKTAAEKAAEKEAYETGFLAGENGAFQEFALGLMQAYASDGMKWLDLLVQSTRFEKYQAEAFRSLHWRVEDFQDSLSEDERESLRRVTYIRGPLALCSETLEAAWKAHGFQKALMKGYQGNCAREYAKGYGAGVMETNWIIYGFAYKGDYDSVMRTIFAVERSTEPEDTH